MVSSKPSDWGPLHQKYSKHGIVLVLGAGVSVDSGLPNWNTLLRNLGETCLPSGGGQLVDDLRTERFSPPAIAAMLRASCAERQDFAELLRQELYRVFRQNLRHSMKHHRNLVSLVRRKNKTLRAVAALCAIAPRPHAFEKNPKIHGIVNFNMDAVLREYVHSCYGKPLLRTIERPSEPRDPAKINIYYVHGYLRFDHKAGMATKEGKDKVVLAEQEYFDFVNNPTGLFTYTFLYLLREYSCLFLGHSMQDDDVRRLLHYSTKERMQAFIERKAPKTPDEMRDARAKAKANSIVHFAVMKRYKSPAIDGAVERSLAQLGTRVLWVKDYPEIPDCLGGMYAAGGNDWKQVYDPPPRI